MNNTCYVYKWTHLPTLCWYVGSRYSKRAHPDDGYICSSKTVKSMIKNNPEQWTRTVIATGTADEMYALETDILTSCDAKNSPRSYNQHNNDFRRIGRNTAESRARIGQALRGRKQSPEHVQARAQALMGHVVTAQTRTLIRERALGRTVSQETREQISQTQKTIQRDIEWCENISQALRGKPKSPEQAQRNREMGQNAPVMSCVHCKKTIKNAGNLNQHYRARHQEKI
jgi:hypothetical protein